MIEATLKKQLDKHEIAYDGQSKINSITIPVMKKYCANVKINYEIVILDIIKKIGKINRKTKTI